MCMHTFTYTTAVKYIGRRFATRFIPAEDQRNLYKQPIKRTQSPVVEKGGSAFVFLTKTCI